MAIFVLVKYVANSTENVKMKRLNIIQYLDEIEWGLMELKVVKFSHGISWAWVGVSISISISTACECKKFKWIW